MRPLKLRHLLSQYGEIGRIFLTPEGLVPSGCNPGVFTFSVLLLACRICVSLLFTQMSLVSLLGVLVCNSHRLACYVLLVLNCIDPVQAKKRKKMGGGGGGLVDLI